MNENTPLLSVIAVSYNHEAYLVETLESIRCQTFQDFELIFCDDFSSDQSVAIALDWINKNQISAQLILHEKNQGLCKTLNEAISLCHGRYVQIVACDDRLHLDKFEKQVAIFENSPPSVAVVCSDANLIDGTGRPRRPFLFSRKYAIPDSRSRETLFKQFLNANCIPAMSALIRRQALLDVGLYDENLAFEDYDMWLRMLRKYDFVVTHDPTVDYRIHGNNMHLSSALSQEYLRLKYQLVRKHLDHPLGREQLRRELLGMIEKNRLCAIDVEDLVVAEFSLQEVADLFQRHQSPWYRWAKKQARSIRRRTQWLFQRN